jgi:hypothetical protein
MEWQLEQWSHHSSSFTPDGEEKSSSEDLVKEELFQKLSPYLSVLSLARTGQLSLLNQRLVTQKELHEDKSGPVPERL